MLMVLLSEDKPLSWRWTENYRQKVLQIRIGASAQNH